MSAVCHSCGNTGYTSNPFTYDCTAEHCTAAATRTALEQAIKDDEANHGRMTHEEALWLAYKMGINSSKENQ